MDDGIESRDEESFYGFIKDPTDALLVIEGCIHGTLRTFTGAANTLIRSGSCFVFSDTSVQMKRWRDGERWSPSRAHGSFLLYREVESTRHAVATSSNNTEPQFQAKDPSSSFGAAANQNIPGLEPSFSEKTLKPNTRILPDGLTKRTISMFGSDGQKYRVISYYTRKDVVHFFGFPHHQGIIKLKTPTEVPILRKFLEGNNETQFKALMAKSTVGIDKRPLPTVGSIEQARKKSIPVIIAASTASSSSSSASPTSSTLLKKRKGSVESEQDCIRPVISCEAGVSKKQKKGLYTETSEEVSVTAALLSTGSVSPPTSCTSGIQMIPQQQQHWQQHQHQQQQQQRCTSSSNPTHSFISTDTASIVPRSSRHLPPLASWLYHHPYHPFHKQQQQPNYSSYQGEHWRFQPSYYAAVYTPPSGYHQTNYPHQVQLPLPQPPSRPPQQPIDSLPSNNRNI
ncbi:Gti1/Pac2 family-domain-containing protein [Obelidium mucronatum]|nr:Gti1/Pac2 family-domain-containing protein [Obelidium mucronatum]